MTFGEKTNWTENREHDAEETLGEIAYKELFWLYRMIFAEKIFKTTLAY